MLSLSCFLVFVGLPLLLLGRLSFALYKNIRIAKASGLKYIIIPFYIHNMFYMIFHKQINGIVDKVVPKSWTASWRPFSNPDFAWKSRYHPFELAGADTFLLVSPTGLSLYTADADLISQVTMRRNDFLKPIEIYKGIDIYGKNVVSTEGAAWRQHRKLTSAPFSEKNNHLVWTESLAQTQMMLDSWVGQDGSKCNEVNHRVAQDAMRLSLHVISRAGFGQEMKWPEGDDPINAFVDEVPPEGHDMSYTYSLHHLLHNLMGVIVVPIWLLKNAPLKSAKKLHTAFLEWGKYMEEMIVAKQDALKMGAIDNSSTDLLSQLVKAMQEEKEKSTLGSSLSASEVMGNAFVFILAGHETSANSIFFSIMFLALNPTSQRRMQKDIEEIFQGRPISEWDYDRDLPKLFGGMVGAVMNEELRVIAPVPAIPKTVRPVPQTVIIDGQKVTLPVCDRFFLAAASVHRNPKYWPHGPSRDSSSSYFPPASAQNDLEEFKPERWLKSGDETADLRNTAMPTENKTAETEDLGVNTASDTSSSLFTPPRGAFIPFSDGYRACLGRRFAQVEILVVLAVIFSQHSVELAVDEWASDEEVARMSKEEKRAVWKKAEAKANHIWQTKSEHIVTVQIRGDHIPLKFVKKGEEKFADIWD